MMRKVASSGASGTVLFVYDQKGQLLGEYDQNGNALREYVWLGSTPVAMFTPDPTPSNPPQVYFIHTDHIDTPRIVVDRSNNIRWRWMAEPFGTTAPETNPQSLGAFTQNLRFPGQYFDQESGLHYNMARYLDSSRAAYTQSDLIGLAGGINTYAYVQGNPLSYIDPMGLDVYLCKQPAFGVANNPLDHHWIKTDTVEAGMGGARGNVPGNESGDMPGDPVQVVPHPNRSKEPGASCTKIDGVDEKKVDDALKLGRPLGRWGPTNQCQSFARQTLLDAGWKPPLGVPYQRPAPGAVPNPLPAFGF